MNNTVRENEHCVIGNPRCGYAFSSSRSCFIAYGFKDSPLEKDIITSVLKDNNIEPVEAESMLSSGELIFCAKICSKIITAQFCVVLLNNRIEGGSEVPNANVNMEYGLMLGFNKYIVPFQREDQRLPFNVAGLDTVKYSYENFKFLAEKSILAAIKKTIPNEQVVSVPDHVVGTFLLHKGGMFLSLQDRGERDIFMLGQQLNFSLLSDFTGTSIIYFGNFQALRPDLIIWRLSILDDIIIARISSLQHKVLNGVGTPEQAKNAERILSEAQVWVLVASDKIKSIVTTKLKYMKLKLKITLFSVSDIDNELSAVLSS